MRRNAKSSGQSAPARLKAAAARPAAVAPAASSAAVAARDDLARAPAPGRRVVDVSAAPAAAAEDDAVVGRDEGDGLRVAAVDAEQERAQPCPCSRQESGWQVVAVRGRERVVDALGDLDLADERVGAERPDAVGARPRPGRLRGEGLVLAEHLHEAADVPRKRLRGKDVDAAPVTAAEHLDDEVLGEARAARRPRSAG